MEKFKTHIVLLSDQVLPNVLPILDANIKPEHVVLCESDAMCKKGVGQHLQQFFKTKGIKAEIYPLGGAYDFRELEERFLELAMRYGDQKNSVAVNLTGGTKLMAIAAQNVFTVDKFTLFYSIPNKNELVIISEEGSPSYKLRDKIRVDDYLFIHGYKVISKKEKTYKPLPSSIDLSRELLGNLGRYGKHISYLNRLAYKAEKQGSLSVPADHMTPDQEPLIELFSNYGYISYYTDLKVTFGSEEDRRFCKGVWLEDFIHGVLKEIHLDLKKENHGEGLQDFMTAVKFESSSGTENELDAAFIYNNNFYVVEAKTAQLSDKGSDVLYKLDSLKDIAGMYTKPIIVTFRSFRGADRKRAEDLGIHVIEGSALNALGRKLKEIMGVTDNSKGDQQ